VIQPLGPRGAPPTAYAGSEKRGRPMFFPRAGASEVHPRTWGKHAPSDRRATGSPPPKKTESYQVSFEVHLRVPPPPTQKRQRGNPNGRVYAFTLFPTRAGATQPRRTQLASEMPKHILKKRPNKTKNQQIKTSKNQTISRGAGGRGEKRKSIGTLLCFCTFSAPAGAAPPL